MLLGTRGVWRFSAGSLSTTEFLKISTEFLNSISENLEKGYAEKLDLHLSDGVLNIHLSNGKAFVINRQTPNKQIWYSSPVSGPARFNFN